MDDSKRPLRLDEEQWERLGHSRSGTTMNHYLHVYDPVHKEAAQAISGRLKQSRKAGELPESVSDSVSELEVVGP